MDRVPKTPLLRLRGGVFVIGISGTEHETFKMKDKVQTNLLASSFRWRSGD